MLTIEPTGAVLGATVRGLDLSQPLDERDMGRILPALSRHGVLRFPDQHLDLAPLKRFSELFGEIQGNPAAMRIQRASTRRSASSRTLNRTANTSAVPMPVRTGTP